MTDKIKSSICLTGIPSVDKLFEKVNGQLEAVELDTEDIIETVMNVDDQNEQLDESVAALCKLVDSLRAYNANIRNLKGKLKEVSNLL